MVWSPDASPPHTHRANTSHTRTSDMRSAMVAASACGKLKPRRRTISMHSRGTFHASMTGTSTDLLPSFTTTGLRPT